MESLYVDEFNDTKRLDIVLSSHEKISSRSEAQKLIKNGNVQINRSSEKATSKKIVKAGDIITFSVADPPQTEFIPVPYDLDIIFEDQDIIIVNKPSGMVVHPAVGHHADTLVNYLLHHSILSDFESTRPGIVHRIDKDTSGLLVVAKNNKSHEKLAKQFSVHQVSRKYEAIVWGAPKKNGGVIDQPLGRHPVHRKKFTIKSNGKHAVTKWRMLKNFNYLSLLECRLETGRTHQIRVHLSSIGHPLLGDPVYGTFRYYANKYSDEVKSLLKQFTGQALHAKSLGFEHPQTGKWLDFQVPLPTNMEIAVSKLEQTIKG